jgi:hypothetical protein
MHYPPPQMGPQPSFLNRLNWKHYSAAAVGLLLLIIVPIVALSFLGNPDPVKKPGAVDNVEPPQIAQPDPNPSPGKPPIEPYNPGAIKPDYPGGTKGNESVKPLPPASEGSDQVADKKKPSRPSRREDSAARDRARKREEAKRLLDQ